MNEWAFCELGGWVKEGVGFFVILDRLCVNGVDDVN